MVENRGRKIVAVLWVFWMLIIHVYAKYLYRGRKSGGKFNLRPHILKYTMYTSF